MGLSLTLMALKQKKPKAEYVVWPRIDQKTCLKCIITAGTSYANSRNNRIQLGLKPLVVSNIQDKDEIRTNMQELTSIIAEKGSDAILCVLSTTSCFAPRAPDRLQAFSSFLTTQ
jgi:O-phospho-L-seryl-tRNASec:L-selenocysteinyl-tRNA synthase